MVTVWTSVNSKNFIGNHANYITRRKNTAIPRLTRFAPIHRRSRATANALQAVGLAGVVLPVMAQGTHRVGGDDIAPLPSQGWAEHPGARHDAPMVRDLGPNRDGAAGQPHPLLSHLRDDVGVPRRLHDRIARA